MATSLVRATVLAALTAAAAAPPQGASAQTTVITELKEVEDDDLLVQPLGLRAEQLEDMSLVGPGGDEIGEVDDVLADATGRASAVSVEAGGFLGVGDKQVVVGLDQIRLENDRLVTGMTLEQVKALPAWDD